MKRLLVILAALTLTNATWSAEFILTIPNSQVTRVVNGMAFTHGYKAVLDNGNPNPESKSQFAKRMLREFIKSSVVKAETVQARDSASQAAFNNASAQISITSN